MNRPAPVEGPSPTDQAPLESCPTCGAAAPADAPCPACGRGGWFAWSDQGERVVRPTGDLINAEPLDRFLKAVEFRQGDLLVVDLSDVHYIASEALGRLLGLRKRLLTAQGRLILRHLDADLQEIFRVTRIAPFFEIEP